MSEQDELFENIKKLKQKAPEIYRHLIGLINTLLHLAKEL